MLSDQTIENQKRIADNLLELCENLDPTCIIAGGAPRDWYFGNPAKDLDVFMYFRPDLTNSSVLRLLKKNISPDLKPLPFSAEGLNYELNPNIQMVYEFKFEGINVQIVLVKKPTWGIVEEFAFNICQAWYKNKKCNYSHDFYFAADKKIIVKTGSLYACTQAYSDRIRKKFSNFKFVETPEDFYKTSVCQNMQDRWNHGGKYV